MAENTQNISDTLLVPSTYREQFLPLGDDFSWPLRERGVLVAGISDLRPPFTIGRTSPTFHAVLYTVSGGAEYVTSSGTGTMRPGEVWIGSAGQPYRYASHKSWRVYWFHLAALPRWSGLRATASRPAASLEALRPAMEGLVAEAVRHAAGAEMAARAYAEIIGVMLDRELGDIATTAVRQAQQQLGGLWEQVNADPAAPWRVAEMAARLNVSPVHLHRLSVRHHGLAPMAMVTRLRMRRAEAMLRSTDYTLDQIAAVIGYRTAFALSRAFKRQYGQSPKAFREPS